MSVVSKNPFDILGDDGESTTPVVIPKTKTSTSSKKVDQAPAKADPARANPNRKKPTGNEGAFRNKDTGRNVNRTKSTEDESAPAKGRKTGAAKPHDRAKSGRSDAQKQVNKSWGSDKTQQADEKAAKNIASAEEAADATEDANAVVEEPEEDNSKTLEEYLAELSTKTAGLNTHNSRREANEGADDSKWSNAKELVQPEEDLFAASKSKTLRKKERKEKVFIETDVNFAPPKRERESAPRDTRRSGRPQQLQNPNRSKGPRAERPKVSLVANDKNFPALGA